MKVKDYLKIESAADISRSEVGRLGTAILFIVAVVIYTGTTFDHVEQLYLLIAAAVIGAYMAINIGANDVANNVGPAVGSFALTLTGAIVIAAIFEAAGAIIAGGDVVSTVKKGIIDPADVADPNVFIWVMMAALIGAALWLNLATWLGAPVSTTHSIVGGVMGAGIAAAGWDIVNWGSMGKIALSWIVSPLTGGIIAALFLYFLQKTIFFRPNPVEKARKVVPFMIGIMTWAFTTYIALKGIKQLIKIDFGTAMLLGLVAGLIMIVIVRPMINAAAPKLEDNRDGVNRLFTIPLIISAALSELCPRRERRGQRGRPAGRCRRCADQCRRRRLEGRDPALGDGDRRAGDLGRAGAVRAEADPHGRVRDHRAGSLARLLHRAGRGDHRDHRQPARHADQLDARGARRGLRRGLPARVPGNPPEQGGRGRCCTSTRATRISPWPSRF